MKKNLHKYWPIITVLVLAVFVAWPTFLPGYFSHHDDLQVMRIFEMRRCLTDLQIPCRWVPDMGYGNGYPLFNYYAVFPYYIGAIASFLLGYLGAAKLLFAIPLFLGSISMFLLASELYGVYPGILASVIFTYAPYRSLDLYVRGAVAESFALTIAPLILYFTLKFIKSGNLKYFIGLSLMLACFLTSHNIMTVLFLPVFLVIIVYWLILYKGKNFTKLILGLAIGVGLSSFFILPAFFEKNLVQIDNLIRLDLNFRAHFVTVNQLFFSRFWGYGASSPGSDDTISFQIGWPHWWIAIMAILVFIIKVRSNHKPGNLFQLILFIIFLSSVFMTHIRSAFIWEKIEILKFTQFPWRFLAVTTFSVSLLASYVMQNIEVKQKKIVLVFLIILTIILNWNYFRPKEFYFDLTDREKLSGKLWDDQKQAAILDYLPVTAVRPQEPAQENPLIISGKATIQNFEKRSNRWQFQVTASGNTIIEVPIFDFPKWDVKVNGLPAKYSSKNYLGRIDVILNKSGQYLVTAKMTDTPIRQVSNTISTASLIILLLSIFYGKNNKYFG